MNEIINKARTALAIAQESTEKALTENSMDELTNVPALLGIVADYLAMLDGMEELEK